MTTSALADGTVTAPIEMKGTVGRFSAEDGMSCMQHAAGLEYLHISHPTNAPEDRNLVQLSRIFRELRPLVVELANSGFQMYKSEHRVTSFVKISAIPKLWPRVRSGELQFDQNGIVYKVEQAEAGPAGKLLVIFSSMASDIYTASLMRHFTQNYSTVPKYIPRNTSILRIADLGGVVGSFYLNTKYCSDNAEKVAALIKHVATALNITANDVVLFGTSKGGTGAVYHGLEAGYRVVAVDPILSDDHYLNKFDDRHFTDGVFPQAKEEVFKNLAAKSPEPAKDFAVIFSERSPQYEVINSLFSGRVKGLYINSQNPQIEDHSDVAPNNMHYITMLLNWQLAGLPLPKGRTRVRY